jgi:hypothetical protein
MAFIATVEHLGSIRRSSFSPSKTGYGTPRPSVEINVRAPVTRPPISITPRCVPKAYAYPVYLGIPVGPNNKGRYNLVRYACLKTTIKWLKTKRAATQQPIYHRFPMDSLPMGLLDRNNYPVFGGAKVPAYRANALKDYVIPDGLETLI